MSIPPCSGEGAGWMEYGHIKNLPAEGFRRLTGVKPGTFDAMVAVLRDAEALRQSKRRYRGGRPPALSIENQLLLALDYWREYRTMFHVAQSFSVSESVAWRTLHWVEDRLIKSRKFSLPGKKALLKPDVEWTVVVVDATETPCERPKKNKNTSTRGRKNATR